MIDYEALGQVHPKLARGQVWCRSCGYTRKVNSGAALQHGWPKCCGYTMTIDSPEEQVALQNAQLSEAARNASPLGSSGTKKETP